MSKYIAVKKDWQVYLKQLNPYGTECPPDNWTRGDAAIMADSHEQQEIVNMKSAYYGWIKFELVKQYYSDMYGWNDIDYYNDGFFANKPCPKSREIYRLKQYPNIIEQTVSELNQEIGQRSWNEDEAMIRKYKHHLLTTVTDILTAANVPAAVIEQIENL